MLLEFAALPDGLRKVVLDYRNQLKAELDEVESFMEKANRGWNVLPEPEKRKRGRPTKDGTGNVTTDPGRGFLERTNGSKRGGRTFTTAQRAEQAARMRKYWEKRRKQAK